MIAYVVIAEKVEEAYESLRQKTTDVYIRRARQLYTVAQPQRTSLLLWTLDDVTVVAMADPSFHGYDNIVRVMREIDPSRLTEQFESSRASESNQIETRRIGWHYLV